MRMKCSVDFRLAPKKSSMGKGAASEPTREEGWVASKCSESDLGSLVCPSLLPEKSVIQWRPALGEDRPYENTGEIVAFTSYLERGLGFPYLFFFSRLLCYYRIQLHHLTPNSFVHISIFVHLCEAFLGIKPHFELFRFLFHLKPQLDSYILDVVGGAGLQLRQRKDRVYIPYSLSNKVIEWKHKWFYIKNQWECFPMIIPGPPIQWPEWNMKPVDESQVPELLEQIVILRQNNLTREVIMFNWMRRRIQSLQARETLVSSIKEQLTHQGTRRKRSQMRKYLVVSNDC